MKKKEYLKPVSEEVEIFIENEILQASNIIIDLDDDEGDDDEYEKL